MGRGESPLEQCGFVISFLIFPLGGAYLLWLIGSDVSHGINNNHWEVSSLEDLLRGMATFSTSLVCLFVAMPLLYGMANRSIAPRLDSIHNLVDDHTRVADLCGSLTRKLEKEHVPAISDCSISDVNRMMDERFS